MHSSLHIGTVILRNPDTSDLSNLYQPLYPDDSISYSQEIDDPQQVFIPKDMDAAFAGLLYVPRDARGCEESYRNQSALIPSTSSSSSSSAIYTLPSNITHLENLPPKFDLIALIPFTQCVSSYLLQARMDGVEAAILFNTSIATNSSSSSSTIPSPSSSTAVNLTTFTSQPQPFPMFLIDYESAEPLINALESYNANMSSVPFGQNLTELYDSTSYVRLAMTVQSGTISTLPGLWLFLLIVLAALCIIVAATSLAMHLWQFRARRDLRRRIVAGDINLEVLGIKKLTVPKEMLDKLPKSMYRAPRSSVISIATKHSIDEIKAADTVDAETLNEDASTNHINKTINNNRATDSYPHFAQTSCMICLGDYVDKETVVRELPCHHIFHPECIDAFLLKRSSLCPICKRSVLPKGYIPKSLQLSNATVARERRIRRLRVERERAGQAIELASSQQPRNHAAIQLAESAPTEADEAAANQNRSFHKRLWNTLFP